VAGALTAAVCVLGLTATADAAGKGKAHRRPDPRSVVTGQDAPAYLGRKPSDHPKLDRKLNERAALGGNGISRAIVVLKPGCSVDDDVAKAGGRSGQRLNLINGQLVQLPNGQLRKLANNPCVAAVHWDRKTGGEMNYVGIVEGARQVQQLLGYDGAGVGVAIIDSGITNWHDDLTYSGRNSAVKVVNGQRVVRFVDFVNGRTSKYDDNGHGTHVAGIIAGNGFDTLGARAGIAPAADIVSLKVLDANGGGYISNVIAALDWVVANHNTYNIRVVNLSVGAAVTESYLTDPLTLAAKRVVDAGVVVVTAAGNLGKNGYGKTQYGAITAPGNAPWVLTVGAYSHQGTLTRTDDKIGSFSSRGPTAVDFNAKPDVVAAGVGTASLSVVGSTLYLSKAAYLLKGSIIGLLGKPYLSLTGTSMAAPVVTGTVALMLQANPNLTPNLVKAIIEYTAQDMRYDPLTQGAGFLNTKGAVDLARFLRHPSAGARYPHSAAWSKTIIWGNKKLQHGVIKPAGSAWARNVVWGAASDAEGDNIVWGTMCADAECDNIVWGTSDMDSDNIVWGTFDQEGDNIVWGTNDGEADNIVWGTACGDSECDNIVWGTECGGADCGNVVWGASASAGELDNIVWGTQAGEADNIVWGTQSGEADNIVWGTSGEVDNIVWGTASEPDDMTWGCSGEDTPVYDDPDVPSVFDGTVDLDGAFDTSCRRTARIRWCRIRRRRFSPTRSRSRPPPRPRCWEASNGQNASPRRTNGDEPAGGHRDESDADDHVGLEAGASDADGVHGHAARAAALGCGVAAGDALQRGSGALHLAAADDHRRVRAFHRVDPS
jgi:serine protease AprX